MTKHHWQKNVVSRLLWQWIPPGIDIIVAIQAASGPMLDSMFRAITFLGDQYAFLVLVVCLCWCVDKRYGLRTALLLLFSAWVNGGLKEVLQIPRPFLVSSVVQPKVTALGYAFPSGHAQLAATLWPWLARTLRNRWMILGAVALVPLIAFSRVYLGVHYPQDVLAGMAVGLVLVYLYSWLQPRLEAWTATRTLILQLAGAIVLPLAMILPLRTDDALAGALGLAGLGIGYLLERRWIDFRGNPGFVRSVGRLAVGLTVLAGIFMGLDTAFPPDKMSKLLQTFLALRFACVGLAATLAIPWLFVRLNLATAQSGSATASEQV